MSAFKSTLAALGATAALALAPGASAQSYDYADCKRSDKDAQVVGGLVGAALGAVVGSQVADRGDRTEGSVVGAIAGAAAGAAIGDDRRNCSEEVYGVSDADLRREVRHGDVRYGDATIYDARHPNRGYDRRRDRRNYNHGGYRSPYEVRAQIERLKQEDRRLKRRAKYDWAPWIERRRDEIRWEVKRLKRIEDRLEDRWDRRRDYRDDYRDYRRDRRDYRRHDYGRRHYHGSTVCYADH